MSNNLKLETLCIQAGYSPKNGEPRQIPIIQSTTFRYENAAFQLGWKITLVCALLFAGIALPVYNSRRQKGKYEKPTQTAE